MRSRERSGLPSKDTRSRSRSTHASGSRTTRPFTCTRPRAIHDRASVREPTPAFERTRSIVLRGRTMSSCVGSSSSFSSARHRCARTISAPSGSKPSRPRWRHTATSTASSTPPAAPTRTRSSCRCGGAATPGTSTPTSRSAPSPRAARPAPTTQTPPFVIAGSIHNGDPTAPGGLPSDPNHIFLQHVWDAAAGKPYEGARQWATRALPHNRAGVTFDGYRFGNEWYLDLGHPDAASYTVEILLHLVRAYDIDGLHLDRIRYPDAPVDRDGGSNVGYNETSVARFNARYGRQGVPRTNDPLWSAWRREQVTQFLRRLYLSATAIKPALNVSAALICYGAGPGKNFASSEAYWHVFQDWAARAREGIVDTLAPMMYKREHLAAQRAQFDSWLDFLMRTARASGR